MADPTTLELANTERLKTNIPSVAFISLVMVIGIVGNVHAILVYGLFYGKGNHRNYILWLATFDLLGCCIHIPMSISHYIRITNCRLFAFVATFFAGYNLVILVIIAADRYRRITSPLKKQLSQRGAQIACTVTCLMFVLISVPNLFIYNANNIDISLNLNLTSNACYTNTYGLFDRVYSVLRSIAVVLLFASCIVLYILILWSLTNHEQNQSSRSSGPKPSLQSTSTQEDVTSTCTIEIHESTEDPNRTTVCSIGPSQNNSIGSTTEDNSRSNHTSAPENESCLPEEFMNKELSKSDNDSQLNKSPRNARNNNHLTKGRRVTIMFMIVSFGACAVYLPTMVMKVLASFSYGKIVDETLQGWTGVFGYFYILNHAINPIVYGFLDARFRQKCKNMYLKLNCRIRQIN